MSARIENAATVRRHLGLPRAPVRAVQLGVAALAGGAAAAASPGAETALVLTLALLAGVSSLWSP
jgi:hypothetical protein